MDAVRINPDGEIEHVQLAEVDSVLPALQRALNCQRVDKITLADGLDMWLDDDGFEVREINRLATQLITKVFGVYLQDYYGPTVLLGANEDTGDTWSVPATLAELAWMRPASA